MAFAVHDTPTELLRWATPHAAAVMFDIHDSRIHHWLNIGRLSFVRWHGRTRLVLLDDVRSILREEATRGRPPTRRGRVEGVSNGC